MTVTIKKSDIRRSEARRKELMQKQRDINRRLSQEAAREKELKIASAVSTRMDYRRLMRRYQEIARLLHLSRVKMKRKEFAIKVRKGRLETIPKEIEDYTTGLNLIKNEIRKQEAEEASINKQLENIRNTVSDEVKIKEI